MLCVNIAITARTRTSAAITTKCPISGLYRQMPPPGASLFLNLSSALKIPRAEMIGGFCCRQYLTQFSSCAARFTPRACLIRAWAAAFCFSRAVFFAFAFAPSPSSWKAPPRPILPTPLGSSLTSPSQLRPRVFRRVARCAGWTRGLQG